MPEFLFGPTPHQAAIDFLKNKPLVSRQVFDRLLPELKARAFAIKGVEDMGVLQSIRDGIAALPAGVPWEEAKKDLVQKLHPFLRTDEENPDNTHAAETRAELLLRTHGFQAYQASAYDVMDRQRDVFPFWQYKSMEDARVRPTHAALDGIVLPCDHEFWKSHFPPWEWGCRCQAIPISQDDYEDIQKADEKRSSDHKLILNEHAQRELTSTRRLVRNGVAYNVSSDAERGKEGAFAWHPGDMRMSLDLLRAQYLAKGQGGMETFHEFEQWAKRLVLPELGVSIWDWLGGSPVSFPIPAVATHEAQIARRKIAEAVFTKTTNLGGGVNDTQKLENGVNVVFKSLEGEYPTYLREGVAPGTQYLREKAASIIDEYLGTDLVPPTEIITHQDKIGSAQLFQKGFKTLEQKLHVVLGELPLETKHKWQLLDDVLCHLDRHPGNIMHRKVGGERKLACIDNGLCLSTTRTNKRFGGPLEGRKISAGNRTRLEVFARAENEIRGKLNGLIEPEAMDQMFKRVRGLLQRGTYGDVH